MQAVGGGKYVFSRVIAPSKEMSLCLYLSTSFLFHLMPLIDIHLQYHVLFHIHDNRQLAGSVAETVP